MKKTSSEDNKDKKARLALALKENIKRRKVSKNKS
jgi:hypothetical protein